MYPRGALKLVHRPVDLGTSLRSVKRRVPNTFLGLNMPLLTYVANLAVIFHLLEYTLVSKLDSSLNLGPPRETMCVYV
jgi:hypothetical protein